MQVSKVSSSTNFGMALKIKPGAVEKLKNASRKEIETLQKVGEELKNTKYYDLVLDENGSTIVSPYANKYRGGTVNVTEPKDEFLHYSATCEGPDSANVKKGEEFQNAIKFHNNSEAKNAYKAIKDASYGPERDAKFIQYLDAREVEKAAILDAELKERKAVEGMVDDLFDKYKTEE